MPTPRTWSVTGLLDHFMEIDATPDRRFAFILGAGASLRSGIPMAGQLVDQWLRELSARENLDNLPLEQWATEASLGIPGFVYTRAVEHYSEVFARRFEDREDEGYAYLEQLLAGKEPSFGYSVLAQVLANTRHSVVITTNFDNLVSDALAIYTHKLPFVCGHESLAGFVRPNPRRPVVLKIHRDLLLAPKNRAHEIAVLPDPLVGSLRELLRHFTPIVLGYGGNDGSLMNLLGETLQQGDVPGGLFWCYWQGGGQPGEPIMKVMRRHGGALIPIPGFDEVMLLLNQRLGYPLMDQRIEGQARARATAYRESVEALQQRIFPPPEPPAEGDAPTESLEPAAPPPRPVSTPGAEPRATLTAPVTRGGGLFGPVLSSRSAQSPTQVDDDISGEAEPPGPPSELEQAALELLSQGPGAADWWKLKLDAEAKPPGPARVAAYRHAVERFPDRLELLRGLALEVSLGKGRSEGRELYTRLERLAPNDPQIHIDLAVLYVHWGSGRTQAEPRAALAWRLARVRPTDRAMQAAIAFVRGLLARREGRDDTTALRVLRGLVPVTAVPILPLSGVLARTIRNRIDGMDRVLYTLLHACLRDSLGSSSLQVIPRWVDLMPLAPEAAWSEDMAEPPSRIAAVARKDLSKGNE